MLATASRYSLTRTVISAFVLGCVALTVVAAPASGQQDLTGRDIMVIRDGAEFKAGVQVVGRAAFGESFRVGTVNGQWLWIESKRGYLQRSDVVPSDQAIDYMTGVITQYPSAATYNFRGWLWHDAGDMDKAFDDFSRAIQLDRQFASAYCNRGHIWWHREDFDRALDDLNEAIRLASNDATTHGYLGDVWYAKGEFDKALAAYRRLSDWLRKMSI
jgi:Tfp pilus assembly protein PilF